MPTFILLLFHACLHGVMTKAKLNFFLESKHSNSFNEPYFNKNGVFELKYK